MLASGFKYDYSNYFESKLTTKQTTNIDPKYSINIRLLKDECNYEQWERYIIQIGIFQVPNLKIKHFKRMSSFKRFSKISNQIMILRKHYLVKLGMTTNILEFQMMQQELVFMKIAMTKKFILQNLLTVMVYLIQILTFKYWSIVLKMIKMLVSLDSIIRIKIMIMIVCILELCPIHRLINPKQVITMISENCKITHKSKLDMSL